MQDQFSFDKVFIVYTTESNQENAKKLAEEILKKKLAACIKFIHINCSYVWDKDIKDDIEIQLIIKTNEKKLTALIDFINLSHSYEIPEVLFWEARSSIPYLKWLNNVLA